MTQLAHICKSLLNGEVLSIMDGYQRFLCTNLPREISRSVEKRFGVTISRDRVEHTSQYGHVGFYFRYRLNKIEANKKGIKAMRKYLKKQK